MYKQDIKFWNFNQVSYIKHYILYTQYICYDQLQFLNPTIINTSVAQQHPRYYHGEGLDYKISEMTFVKQEDWTDEKVDVTYYMGENQIININHKLQYEINTNCYNHLILIYWWVIHYPVL